uniref:Bpu10I restriction endonuclease n=1 Tax=Candidatus Kentrum sp. TC TaxID=2126339 RepID=A0A450ZMD0_9GAMM|nr:MAG: Bpu10I restriction endonuclease [Candidatus Kentron sp. TC]
MSATPHKEKLDAALRNPKCSDQDRDLLSQASAFYSEWREKTATLTATGADKVREMTDLLNEYKDRLEVELIARDGSPFIRRQKGQLKLDNSVLEEFLILLVDSKVISRLPDNLALTIGPTRAFMSLSFNPANLAALGKKPDIVLKLKDQDFIIGKDIHYKFSPDPAFPDAVTASGFVPLAVLAAECKVNLDKTMFQEAAGTAARLKQGCPHAQYYVLNEYLDMSPEDCRLTAVDNVYLLRHAKRLPFEKRNVYDEVRRQRDAHPIDPEVVLKFVENIETFVNAVWYDPDAALTRGSFV